MEHVEGVTLRRWLRVASRGWAEILARFIDAGRGLAAAHEAGIVHRDFKPANALVGPGERVRVVDFGLARGVGHETDVDEVSPKPADSASGARLTTRLTGTGRLAGTPAYMSPEQCRGAGVDPRSDQFSFK